MSTQLLLGAVGAVALGPLGAGLVSAGTGFVIGSTVGGLLDRPDGPTPGDLTAPNIQEGHQLVRPYGTVMLTCHPVSVSEYTATANETGGKGGPPDGSAGYTYTLDALCVVAQRVPDIPLQAVLRVFINKKLVETRRADSTSASLEASVATEAYTSLILYPGGSSQMPPPAYEDRVGTVSASAYRNVATVEIIGLVCGGSKTPPLVEIEVTTSASETGALTLLQSRFLSANADDESYYAQGSPTQNGGTVTDGLFVVDRDHATDPFTPSSLTYGMGVSPNGLAPIVFEMIGTFEECPNIFQVAARLTRSDQGGVTHIFGWKEDGTPFYRAPPFGSPAYGTVGGATHFAVVFSLTSTRVYINGVLVDTALGDSRVQDAATMVVELGDEDGYSSDATRYTISGFRVRQEETYTAGFTRLASIPPPDGPSYTGGTADLQDIVDAELSMNPAIVSADHDTSDLAGVPVRGFKAAGPPGKTIAELGDVFYFDCVPGGNQIAYRLRGGASVSTIANVDTGAGVDQAGEPFTGLKIGNDIERPAVIGLSAPNAMADHERVFRRGDRLTTEGPDVSKVRTEVGLNPDEVQGRALAMTLMARASSQTAEFGLSDKYAASEPGDVHSAYDDQGNLYSLFIRSLTYADGVRQCKWEHNDTSALVETGITDESYTPSLIVEAIDGVDWLPMDLPLLRDVDNDPGYYVAVKPGTVRPARWMQSQDNVLYNGSTSFSNNATFGTVTAVSGSFPANNVFDESSTIAVNVGDGTLSSVTRAALLADLSLNSFKVGVPDRQVIGQFRTATLVGDGVYTLSGLLLGAKGTEQYASSIAVNDDFCLLTFAGMDRIVRTTSQLGLPFYVKAVPQNRPVASVTGELFFNDGIALRPLQPVRVRASRNASGDIELTWTRRTRLETRFGGDFGDACPLGEDSEQYEVRFYTSNTFATVVAGRTQQVTSATLTYTSAQQTTDFGGNQSTVHVSVAQISAVVGVGYQRRASV